MRCFTEICVNRKKKYVGIITNTILILLLIVLYLVIRTKTGIIVDNSKTFLTDNWTLTVNGVPQEEHCLKDLFFPVTNIGDTVELTTTLPTDMVTRPTIQFRIYHSIITVYIDGQPLYQYGKALNDAGEMVGSGFHWVSLPDDCAGKELKIRFDVTEDNAFSSIEEIPIMPENDATRNFILTNIVEIIIGIFLFSFGILLSGVVIFLGKLNREYRILFWIAIFSITVALWMLSNFGIMQLVFKNLQTIAYFEYLSLYFAPIPMLLFVYDIQDNKKTKHAVLSLVAVLILFITIVLLFNQLNIFHFSKALPIFHILGLCTIVLTTFSNISARKHQNRKSERIILYGLAIMVMFLFADIIRFNTDKYLHPKNVNLSSSILPVGVLTFIIAMIASYIYRLVMLFYESAEKQTLIQIAYTDALTQIGNRAMCEKMFQERETTRKETTIINFDLNHFKEVNDTFGHSTGDELLIEFAKILQDNYQKDGFIGRMGGDEFIVLLDNTDTSYIEKTLADLMSKIDALNHKENRLYQISVAYGYESNKDNPNRSLWEIYQKSDSKMYQNKANEQINPFSDVSSLPHTLVLFYLSTAYL